MSGSVFVLDAQGSPLMPMSAAHARVLLTRGAAQQLSHAPFTTLQLTRSIPAPVLHPVVVGVGLSSATVELFVLATSLRAVHPLLYIVVDMDQARYRRSARSSPAHPIRGRIRLPLHLGTANRAMLSVPYIILHRHIRIIAQAIIALQTFIPLTHIMVLPSDGIGAIDGTTTFPIHRASWPRRTLAQVLATLTGLGLVLAAPLPTTGNGVRFLPDISQIHMVLETFQTHPTLYAPAFVAITHEVSLASLASTIVPGIPALRLHQDQDVCGILRRSTGCYTSHAILRVPTGIGPRGIIWRLIRLPDDIPLRHLSTSLPAFLPLSPFKEDRDRSQGVGQR